MKRKHFTIALFCSFFCITCFAQQDQPVNYGNNPKAGSYYNNNGTTIYYEVYGEGKPVVLLHGNGGLLYTWRQL